MNYIQDAKMNDSRLDHGFMRKQDEIQGILGEWDKFVSERDNIYKKNLFKTSVGSPKLKSPGR